MDGQYVDGSYYFYAPNDGAAIFFAIAFLTVGAMHVWQSTQYRSWLLTPLFPFCCLLFTVGFTLRAYGAFHYDNLPVFIASICITYAAPPLLELQNYHVLGRMLYYVPYCSPLHPGRVLTTFGFLSMIIEALNGWGASYSSNQSLSDSELGTGHALVKASLILQLVVIVLFVGLSMTFHLRCRRSRMLNGRLQSSLLSLYISSALILIRTTFRTVEYFGLAEYRYSRPDFNPQSMSAMIRYEIYFYIFEASLMLINCLLWTIRHPRRYLPPSDKIYLATDGVTEIEGPGFRDPRPFWQTTIDPFDLSGLIRGRSHVDRFWETQAGPDLRGNKTQQNATSSI